MHMTLGRASVCLSVVLMVAGCGGGGGGGGGGAGGGAGSDGAAGGAAGQDGAPGDGAAAASLSGVVVDLADTPLAGVHVRAGGKDVVTAADGTFALAGLDPASTRVLDVDGSTLVDADTGRHFGRARRALALAAGDASLDLPVRLALLNQATDLSTSLTLDPAAPQTATVTSDLSVNPEGTHGVELRVPAGTRITWPPGTAPGTLSVTALPVGGLPFSVPGGAGLALQVEPEGLTFEPPADADGGVGAAPALVLTNDLGLDEGVALSVVRVGPSGELSTTGSAVVSTEDGLSVLTLTPGEPPASRTREAAAALPSPHAGAARTSALTSSRELACTGMCVLQCETRTYGGRVVDQLGAAQKNVEVRLYEGGVKLLRGVVVATARSDDRGEYLFPPAKLCRWQVEANDELGQTAIQTGGVPAHATDALVRVDDLVVTRYSAPVNIEVQAKDPAGLPWRGITVMVQPKGEPWNAFAAAVTDDGGVARLWAVRYPLQLGGGREPFELEISAEAGGCLPPVAVASLPPPSGPVQAPKLDKSGLPVWKAERTYVLDAIGTKTDGIRIDRVTPSGVSTAVVTHEDMPKDFPGTPVTVALEGKGIAARAAVSPAGGAASLSCAGGTLRATFKIRFFIRRSTDSSAVFQVWNPDGKKTLREISILSDPLVLKSISRTSFATLQPAMKIQVAYSPLKVPVVLADDKGKVCADVIRQGAVLGPFTEPMSGALRLYSVIDGCAGDLSTATQVSNDISINVASATPAITGVTPAVVTATMRRLGFDLRLDGTGLNPSKEGLAVWIGDRDLRDPVRPLPEGPGGLPENAPSFSVDVGADERQALNMKGLTIRIPPGQLPDALAVRTTNGRRERVGVIAPAPGGGIAYSMPIKFTADLLCGDHNGGCHPDADCFDFATSVTCACKDGYVGDGHACADVDECAVANGGCGAHAACKNTPGARTCTCNPGYASNGTACVDVDECLTANGGCDAHASCANTDGGRTCACNAGYVGDGVTCADPCATNNGGCGANQTCAVVDQKVSCACKPGYLPDPDAGGCYADPCAVNNGGCGANFTCFSFPPPDPAGCECEFPNLYDPDTNSCLAP